MKRKQKILSNVIMTLLGVGGTAISFSASAAYIDLRGDTTTAAQLATYASEIKTTTDLTYTLPSIVINLGGPVSTDTVAVPSAETRYARFTLENATIATGITPALVGGASGTGASPTVSAGFDIGSGGCQLVSGQTTLTPSFTPEIAAGGASQAYVTFAIKAKGTTAATDKTGLLSAGCVMSVNLGKIKVTTPGQPVKLTYGLFSGPIAAANNTIADTRNMNKQGITVVQFAPALTFKANTLGKDAIPSVATQFKLFKSGETNTNADSNTSQKRASVGAFDFTVATPQVLDTGGTNITSVGLLLNDATKLKVEGDFAGIRATGTNSTYYLSANASCSSVAPNNLSAPGTPDWGTNSASSPSSVPLSISFNLTDVTTTLAGKSPVYFCLELGEKAPGFPFDSTKTDGVAIPDSNGAFKVTLVPDAKAGYSISGKAETLKAIKRDGVTLEAPFINIAPGYTSRVLLAHYNKNSAADAPFFVSIRGYNGEPQPTQNLKSGILKKGTTLKIMSTELFSVPTGAKTHVGISINFHASSDDIQGVVQHINSTTGEVTSIPMIRPGGGRQ